MKQLNIEDMVGLYEKSKANPVSFSNKELEKRYGVSVDQKTEEVIATRDFSQGEIIKEVSAYGVTDLETMMKFEKKYEDEDENIDPEAKKLIDESIQIEKGIYLVSESDFEFSIKHSCDPNSAFVQYKDEEGKTQHAFKVLKPIKKGDKIRFDYSTVTGDEYILECACGEKACRGFAGRPMIHSDEEKKKILARYPEGWILPYIQKELEAPFSKKKLAYLDEPYTETVMYTFGEDNMEKMKELLEKSSTFHPKFKDMMLEYIEEEE